MEDDSVLQDQDERRRGDRIPVSGMAKLQVIESGSELLDGLTFESELKDLSPQGLRLECDRSIEGCKLDMWVQVEGRRDKIFLAADVRWVRELGDDRFQAGVQLIDNPLSDFSAWLKLFSALS
ncbi:MAG: PilZ domain-containing protein [Pseudomonadales bacterium]|nr:PilZ domain-containing protein [Pseudomonadales bacterium]